MASSSQGDCTSPCCIGSRRNGRPCRLVNKLNNGKSRKRGSRMPHPNLPRQLALLMAIYRGNKVQNVDERMIPMKLKENESGNAKLMKSMRSLGRSKRISLVKLVYHRRLRGRLGQTKLELRCLMLFWALSKPLQRARRR